MNSADFHRELARHLESGVTVVVAAVIATHGSSPGKPGQKMGITSSGKTFGTAGGGGLEQAILADAETVMRTGEAVVKRYSMTPKESGGLGMLCGGEAEVVIERIGGTEQIVLIGGGHIAEILAEITQAIGKAVQIVDSRPEYANAERFPRASAVHNIDPSSPELSELLPEGAPIVILTHSHALDEAALKNVLGFATGYVGMIGSKKKVGTIFKRLEEEGVPREKLDKVHSPIGLDIGAVTPGEIALAILAEIVGYERKSE